MSLDARLQRLERAIAPGPALAPAPTAEEFRQLSVEDKIRFLRGQLRFAYPPAPPATHFHGTPIADLDRMTPEEFRRWAAALPKDSLP